MGLFRRRYTSRGAAPGTLGSGSSSASFVLKVLDLDVSGVRTARVPSPGEVLFGHDGQSTRWIQVTGLGDGSELQQLGQALQIHPLAISDMHNVGQRPKAENYKEGIYVVLRNLVPGPDEHMEWQQVSLFIGSNWVLSVLENASDLFDPVEQRMQRGNQNILGAGPEYLGAGLIDVVVDGYFPILETLGRRLEDLEDEVLEGRNPGLLRTLYLVRRDLTTLRRAALPMHSALDHLSNHPQYGFSEMTRLSLRDTLDHANQIVDVDASYRDLSTSLIDVHLSIQGQKTNETMRLLTVISTVFIPLTFLAGIYGMNFDTSQPGNMPELRAPYAYPVFLGICAAIALALLVLFYRLGWLGNREELP